MMLYKIGESFLKKSRLFRRVSAKQSSSKSSNRCRMSSTDASSVQISREDLLEQALAAEARGAFEDAMTIYAKVRKVDFNCWQSYLGEARGALQLNDFHGTFKILEEFHESAFNFDQQEIASAIDQLLAFASPLFLSNFNKSKADMYVLMTARLYDELFFDARKDVSGSAMLDFYRLAAFCEPSVATKVRGLLAPIVARSQLNGFYGAIARKHMIDPRDVVFLVVGQMRGYAESAKQFAAMRERGSEVLVVSWEKSGFRIPTTEPSTVWHLSRTFPPALMPIFAEHAEQISVVFPHLKNVRALFEGSVDLSDLKASFHASDVLVRSEDAFEQENSDLIDRIWKRDPTYGQHSSPLNSAKMIYLNHVAENFLTTFEEARGQRFEYVFRCRPDAIVDFDRFPLERIAYEALADDQTVVIDHQKGHPLPLCGDRLSFSNREVHRRYASLWSLWQQEATAVGYALHGTFSHTRLADFLTYESINIKARQDLILRYDISRQIDPERLHAAFASDLESAEDSLHTEIISKILSALKPSS